MLISESLVITTSRLFIIELGVSRWTRIPFNDSLIITATANDTVPLSSWVCWTVRWEWIWGQPGFLSFVSENRKLLGRGKLPSCWPRPPASSQPLWASCSEHYSPSAGSCCLYTVDSPLIWTQCSINICPAWSYCCFFCISVWLENVGSTSKMWRMLFGCT